MTIVEHGYVFHITIKERQSRKGYVATIICPPTHFKRRRDHYDNPIQPIEWTLVARSKEKIARKVKEAVLKTVEEYRRLDYPILEFDVEI